MMYLDSVAAVIRSHVDPKDLPSGDVDQLFRLYAVLLLAKGTEVTVEDVHNAWVAWMASVNPEHDALKPFNELSRNLQQEDEPFALAIRRVAGASAHG